MTRMTALHPDSFSPYFASSSIRVMIFLRDDMLEQVVRSAEGFTALTHVTARQADTLRWTEDQILAMVVKRFFANQEFADYLEISRDRTEANASYRKSAFGKIFPPTVFRGSRQSPTIRWICNRCADGRGVVTPRDILDLSIRAKQRQQDLYVCMPQIQTVHRTTSLAQPKFNTGSRNCQNANERLISKPNFRISGRTSESSWGQD